MTSPLPYVVEGTLKHTTMSFSPYFHQYTLSFTDINFLLFSPFAGLLANTLFTFKDHACAGDKLHLRCPYGTTIRVQWAQYGRQVASHQMCGTFDMMSAGPETSTKGDFLEDTNCLAKTSLEVGEYILLYVLHSLFFSRDCVCICICFEIPLLYFQIMLNCLSECGVISGCFGFMCACLLIMYPFHLLIEITCMAFLLAIFMILISKTSWNVCVHACVRVCIYAKMIHVTKQVEIKNVFYNWMYTVLPDSLNKRNYWRTVLLYSKLRFRYIQCVSLSHLIRDFPVIPIYFRMHTYMVFKS